MVVKAAYTGLLLLLFAGLVPTIAGKSSEAKVDGIYLNRRVQTQSAECARLEYEWRRDPVEGSYIYLTYLGKGPYAHCFRPALGESLVGWDPEGALISGTVKGYRAVIDNDGIGFVLAAEPGQEFSSGLICTSAKQAALAIRPLMFREMTEAEREKTGKNRLKWAGGSFDNDRDSWVNDEVGLMARRVFGDEDHYATHFWYKGQDFEEFGTPRELYISSLGLLVVQNTYGSTDLINFDSPDLEVLLRDKQQTY